MLKKVFITGLVVGVILCSGYYLWASRISQESDIEPSSVPAGITTQTIYVSPRGDDRNTGIEASPYQTIQHALEFAQPGTEIKLAPGHYDQSVTSVRDGEESKPIRITGSKEAIVRHKAESGRLIEINHDFIQLHGFTLDGHFGSGDTKDDYTDKLLYVIGTETKKGVEGLLVSDMLIQNAGGECVRLRYFAKKNEVKDSTIKDCGLFDFRFSGGGKNGEGIYIGTAPEQRGDGRNPTADPDISEQNWIHNNTIETNANECVDIKEAAVRNVVENNHCSNQRDSESGGFDSRGENNLFRGNTVTNARGAGFRLGGDEETDGINNQVVNNTIVNTKYGIKVMRTPQKLICGNTFTGIDPEDIILVDGQESGEIYNRSCN